MEEQHELNMISKQTIMSQFGKVDVNEFISEDDSYCELRMSDSYVHSKIYAKNPLKDLTHMFMSILPVACNCSNILILGAGGGGQCLQLLNMLESCKITAVEIDPVMIGLTRRFLGERIKQVQLIEQDAYVFLQTTQEVYDCIIVDLFCDSFIPDFMLDCDFYRIARKRLSATGILTVNTGLPGKPYQYADVQQNTVLQLSAAIRQVGYSTILYQDIFDSLVFYAFQQTIDRNEYNTILKKVWVRYKEPNIKCSLGGLLLMSVMLPAEEGGDRNQTVGQSLQQHIFHETLLAKRLLKLFRAGNLNPHSFADINIQYFIKSKKMNSDPELLAKKYYEDVLVAAGVKNVITSEEIAKYVVIKEYLPKPSAEYTLSQKYLYAVWMAVYYIKKERAQDALFYMDQALGMENTK